MLSFCFRMVQTSLEVSFTFKNERFIRNTLGGLLRLIGSIRDLVETKSRLIPEVRTII